MYQTSAAAPFHIFFSQGFDFAFRLLYTEDLSKTRYAKKKIMMQVRSNCPAGRPGKADEVTNVAELYFQKKPLAFVEALKNRKRRRHSLSKILS